MRTAKYSVLVRWNLTKTRGSNLKIHKIRETKGKTNLESEEGRCNQSEATDVSQAKIITNQVSGFMEASHYAAILVFNTGTIK